MDGDNGVGWPTCSEEECVGIRLDAGGKCLAHAEDQDLAAELKRVGDEGTIDARGVTISATLLDRIVAAAPRGDGQPRRPRFDDARFDGASFGDGVSFGGTSFGNGVSFNGASFGDGARFDGAAFGNGASFNSAKFANKARFGARFGSGANFDGASFGNEAKFGGNGTRFGASFGDEASFAGASFGNGARFGGRFGNWARFDGAAFGHGARFDGAQFGNWATFVGAAFGDGARFSARFGNWAKFDGAQFGDWARFADVALGDVARFDDASFGSEARFDRATFGNGARFANASFGNGANFDSATFGNGARFDSARFGDGVRFAASFGDGVRFDGASFGSGVNFDGATFGDEAMFDGATFQKWARFGPLLSGGRFVLDQATFGQGCELAISADRLDCRGLRLPDGAWLNVRWAEIRLDGVDFGRPTVLAGVGPFPDLNEALLRPRVTRSWRTSRPRVLSLRGSDVRNLVLSNVDLRACRFTGAHNLDQLRLEATIDLADRPAGLRAGWAIPPLWQWTRRRTLAEEHRWRRGRAKHAGWYPRACRVHGLAEQERPLLPADIALLYRALRKGREDSKDEPGAADFYYGEMEMRRHDRSTPWAERVVLWLYWLVAGYALRATRALGCLLGLLAVATVLLATVGFAPAPSATSPPQRIQFDAEPAPAMTAARPLPDRLGTAALVAVEGAVFRASDQALTYRGRLIHTTLRFVGPVLLGLALLSIRGRVKR